MIVSDSKRFVFVHVPKTAGKSVSAALQPYAAKGVASDLHIHETISEFYQRVRKQGRKTPFDFRRKSRAKDASAQYADYFSFGFVRNPWARAVSSFGYLRKVDLPETRDLDFDRFIADLDSGAHYLRSILIPRPQIDYFTDYRGDIIVDQIGKYESLADDFASICERIGIGLQLEWRNKSDHGSYVDYFDDAKRLVIERIYARDIEAFGYRFDDAA
ncbi:MAG: sulfotransferase family 2 domain-containing protein [Pseudomonadota bacterium]